MEELSLFDGGACLWNKPLYKEIQCLYIQRSPAEMGDSVSSIHHLASKLCL